MAVAVLLGTFGVVARAQDASQADKDRALAYLESTKKGVLDATKGLSDAQWNFKAGPDRWSIAQVIEHLALAEDLIRGGSQKVMGTPVQPARDAAEVRKIDEVVVTLVAGRAQKAQAIEPLQPKNAFGSPTGSLDHFLQGRAATEEYLKITPGLRAHYADRAPFGKLDGYEWILFVAAHSERHTKQILEVRADPNYPK
jgi:DinB superfamily